MNPDNDTLIIADTQCSEVTLLSEQEQAAQAQQVNHNSMTHFKIIDILGKGGMGAVYKAKDLALERFVAIKMLRISDAQEALILAEAKTISKLNHPNIVTIYDIARDGDSNFIVMEWVNGRPLNAVIPPQGLALNIVIDYAKQMVAALACAHQQQVIHRDIKPQNIMVDINGQIKILDFGIAALLEPNRSVELEQTPESALKTASTPAKIPLVATIVGDENSDKKSSSLAITGSVQYMAPEQIQGQMGDARSDLFSFGIVLYEMLAGVKPFLGFNLAQITDAITQGKYTPLAELIAEREVERKLVDKNIAETGGKPLQLSVPVELIAVVDKLLQTKPDARYQNAQELAQDLAGIDQQLREKKNWWQQQHWLTQSLFILPIIAVLGWSVRSVLFPPSTQELIARQLVEAKKIAFLPFDNISGDPVLQIFSDGVATMLSSDLAEVGYQQGDGSTWVLPTSEIRQLDDPSVSGIYNKYGVDTIVTGSIQHMGSTRSLHLSLVNGADGRQLKSIQLTLDANNLFAAQSEIRQQVMNLLGWQIPAELTARFAAQKPAFDGAYKHYLAGRGYLYRFDHEDNIAKALAAFNAAISLDPNYGDAYVGLAEAQLRSFIEFKDTHFLKQMESSVEQLQQIDANHLLLSYLQAELKLNQGEYAQAVELFKQSIALQPRFLKAYTSLSLAFMQLGKGTQAERVLMKAYALMPNNNAILVELGLFHYSNGDYQQAISYFEVLAQQAPNNYIAHLNISACHYLLGDTEQAIFSAKKSLEIQPNADGFANLGTYYFILKDFNKAVNAYEQMIILNGSDYIKWGNLADAYRFANNPKYTETFQQAIELAEKAFELNSNNKNAIASLAYYYANIGNVEKTYLYAKRIDQKDTGADNFLIAAAYARLKIKLAALNYLKYAIANNYSIAEITSSPLLEHLASDEEYLRLISE
ncbi:serine/threonine-protein kinase [Cognaticolwellia aestuarii]|uniref:serine/threonine-protein kinase n=1 Tax=Cognaticolwellia aestuarii TaxID=329993 RepID=UPI001178049F|nr:serine/threonine-protein kinase [Cognaticolwellia aestuarii]